MNKIFFVIVIYLYLGGAFSSELREESKYAPLVDYAQAIIQGEILERRSIPPYFKVGSYYYRYRIKLLVDRVFKGSPQLSGKILTFETYFEPRRFGEYSPGKILVLPFAEIHNNLEAIPLNYSLISNLVELDVSSLEKMDFHKTEIKPIEEYFRLDIEGLYYSDEIILGYFINKTILPRKGETLNDIPKAHYDKKPDHYIVYDFYVKRVLKGNKYFEDKTVHFVDYPWSDKRFSLNGIMKRNFNNPPKFDLGKLELLRLDKVERISKSIDENYTGPYGYNVNRTGIVNLEASREPIIKIYLRKAASPTYRPPPKSTPFLTF